MSAFAPTLQSFFTNYLIDQRGASPHTIVAYRDTFRLLLGYIRQRTGIWRKMTAMAWVRHRIQQLGHTNH